MAGPSGSSAATMQESMPICFDMSTYKSQEVEGDAKQIGARKHQLHGADDLLSLFDLRPLWERSVKPYSGPSRSSNGRLKTRSDGRRGEEGSGVGLGEEEGEGATYEAPKVMEKTYAEYVRDLPGRVRPPKRTISRFNNALTAANAAGEPPPTLPTDLAGRTTMRDIVFRPETTVQRVGPFDQDALRAAFTVEAGDAPDIDLSLLESDEVDRQAPSKKKKKRKHQREPTDRSAASDETAAKRSRLNAIVSGRSTQQKG